MINKVRRQFIADNWQTMTDGEIARLEGCNRPTISKMRRRMGLNRTPAYLRHRKGDEMLAMYLDGMPIGMIAEAIGEPRQTVSNALMAICSSDVGLRVRRTQARHSWWHKNVRAKRRPSSLTKHGEPEQPRVLMTAEEYGALFYEPNERFLMLMRRRQEVKELLLKAAGMMGDGHSDDNVVGHLLPHYKDLNRAVLKLAPCVGK